MNSALLMCRYLSNNDYMSVEQTPKIFFDTTAGNGRVNDFICQIERKIIDPNLMVQNLTEWLRIKHNKIVKFESTNVDMITKLRVNGIEIFTLNIKNKIEVIHYLLLILLLNMLIKYMPII